MKLSGLLVAVAALVSIAPAFGAGYVCKDDKYQVSINGDAPSLRAEVLVDGEKAQFGDLQCSIPEKEDKAKASISCRSEHVADAGYQADLIRYCCGSYLELSAITIAGTKKIATLNCEPQ